MLILTRKTSQSIIIDGNIEITIVESVDGKVKIGIEAPKEIEIFRKEVYEKIQEENRLAVKSNVDTKSIKDVFKRFTRK